MRLKTKDVVKGNRDLSIPKKLKGKINIKFHGVLRPLVKMERRGILEEKEVEEGDDLAKLLSLEEIYFDLDTSKIRPNAEVELQKIIAAMKEYPQLRSMCYQKTSGKQKK
ncbi:hypothetical protein ACFSTE_11450 [Aquimarina hainanensis]|uniref:SpoVT-AbrB domain-containing protein n=1 Tax=Aquimarina hainanensis TaxID=1578017 RepID=A0ABW5N746_9FLAO